MLEEYFIHEKEVSEREVIRICLWSNRVLCIADGVNFMIVTVLHGRKV